MPDVIGSLLLLLLLLLLLVVLLFNCAVHLGRDKMNAIHFMID